MHRTRPELGASERVSSSEVEATIDPAWQPWVDLLDVAFAEGAELDPLSGAPLPQMQRPLTAPLLHGVTLRVDPIRTRSLLQTLLSVAEESRSEDGHGAAEEPPPNVPGRAPHDVQAILVAAIGQDSDAMHELALTEGLQPGVFDSIAQLAVLPILRACAEQCRSQIPPEWEKGYCPVCGAWPAVAEMRGLERSRRLRCGRCGFDWPLPVLKCAFCGELDHRHLYALVPDEHEQTRRVDVCASCNAYLKTFATLRPMTLRSLALLDLETIELDVIAQERGFNRPLGAAFPLSVNVLFTPSTRASAPV